MEVNLTITDTQFHEANSRGDLNYLTVNPKEEQVVTTEGKTSKLVCKIAGSPTVNQKAKGPLDNKFLDINIFYSSKWYQIHTWQARAI